jgi:hypothetical protein
MRGTGRGFRRPSSRPSFLAASRALLTRMLCINRFRILKYPSLNTEQMRRADPPRPFFASFKAPP